MHRADGPGHVAPVVVEIRLRVALVGAAACCARALSGMGTSPAVIDACRKLAEGNGKWFVPPTRAWLKFRNLNYRLLPYLPWRKLIEELPLKAGNAITLKRYAGAPV
ncbi:hypothetical protein MUY14_32035 [Amycolatopsis sp. FBCC-B4732]|uniref:hypothetical protein n=1 Tax=Amycolatopsis sp. FBCC-B4732 TaxID=3079339 RepID=UPI001FF28566|nr:hypothetical protein [Amycolatopsis sp. FBCC-B4732]UOX86359.1 hypothetical protein MUY14_32035 [Amycolatopsis sp. FBCC-B4732]